MAKVGKNIKNTYKNITYEVTMNKTARGFLLDNMFSMSAFWACSGSVVAALTGYYGFSLPVSNFITGLTATLPVMQLVGGIMYVRSKHRFAVVRVSNAAWRLLLPMVFFSVLLPVNIAGAVMVACYFAMVFIYQLSCPAQTDWMVSRVEGNTDANYYSVREMCFMLSFTASSCAVSMILNRAKTHDEYFNAFIIVGILLAALLIVSIFTLFSLPPPAQYKQHKTKKLDLKSVFKNKPYMLVMLSNASWSFSAMFVGSFAAVYQIQVLHVSFAQIMIWGTVGNIVRSLLTPVMSRIAQRKGWRYVIILCFSVGLLLALIWFVTTGDIAVFMFPLVLSLGGVPNAGLSVAYLKMQVASTPADERSIYFSTTAFCNGIAALTGSALCSLTISSFQAAEISLKYIFIIGAACILLSLAFECHNEKKARKIQL
ncbi:MAG: MFS transporter [Clostridia bacterium]|jgi:hypothetical protein|nr:MFS transporter [Clostridia bacterium]